AESYKRAQSLGHASGATAQRLADLQKVISPPASSKKTAQAAMPASAPMPAFPVITTSPTFQYGAGSNGSLAMPPYVAPSQ
ncbi:MAG TPA: hypothetical protein VKS80_00350, partial [Trinickia sp.]|nr:hypothetical protein [Trinickia sp.]